MESYIKKSVFLVMLSLLLAGNSIEGRREPKDYWGEMMKEQPMPEAIKDFMNPRSYEILEHEKAFKDFEPIPHTTAYLDDVNPNHVMQQFIKDFEPIPHTTAYLDDVNPNQVMQQFIKDFEPIPHTTAYRDDDPASKKLSVADDFEPIPNTTAYSD